MEAALLTYLISNKFLFNSTRTVADYYIIYFRASAEFSFESYGNAERGKS